MGKAIILPDSDFSAYGLGTVTRLSSAIMPAVNKITSATVFYAYKDGVRLSDVSWSISDSSLASLVSNQDGGCTVTPLQLTTAAVTLTASFSGGPLSISFLATIGSLDITSLVATHFFARKKLGAFWSTSSVLTDAARCCIEPFAFSDIGINISQYSRIILTLKTGYDYIFGTGTAVNNESGWQGWNGSTGGQSYAWVTDNRQAIATVDNTVGAMSCHLRHHDTPTAEFSASTVLTDIVDSILLVE